MRIALMVTFLMAAAAVPARAGAGSDSIDFFYLQPLVGAETLYLETGTVSVVQPVGLSVEGRTSTSVSLGATAGMRLGALRLGLLLQRGTHAAGTDVDAVTDKVFGEVGLHAWLIRGVALSPHFALGWASLHGDAMTENVHGVGGKVGMGVDFYPAAAFSVGLRVDADGQAYRGRTSYSLAYGFTVALGIGVHL